jgi:hypothetical protein
MRSPIARIGESKIFEFDAGFLCCRDHAVAFLERYRGRLLADHMLAVLGRDDGVLAMDEIGRRDPNRIDIFGAAHRLDRVESRQIEALLEIVPRLGADIGAAAQAHALDIRESRQDLGRCRAKTRDADAQFGCHVPSRYLAAIWRRRARARSASAGAFRSATKSSD